MAGKVTEMNRTTAIDQFVEFPAPIEVNVNQTKIPDSFKGIKGKLGSAKPADLTEHIKMSEKNYVDVLYAYAKDDFLMYIYICERVSVATLEREVLAQPHISKEQTVALMKRLNAEVGLETSKELISLADPCSFLRMEHPCRSIKCEHIQCFDASSFLTLQKQATTWLCPVCSKKLKMKHLAIDDYFNEIISATAENIQTVQLDQDGNWSPVDEEELAREHHTNNKKHDTPADVKEEDNNFIPPEGEPEVISLLSDGDDDEDEDESIVLPTRRRPHTNFNTSSSLPSTQQSPANSPSPVHPPQQQSSRTSSLPTPPQPTSTNEPEIIDLSDFEEEEQQAEAAAVAAAQAANSVPTPTSSDVSRPSTSNNSRVNETNDEDDDLPLTLRARNSASDSIRAPAVTQNRVPNATIPSVRTASQVEDLQSLNRQKARKVTSSMNGISSSSPITTASSSISGSPHTTASVLVPLTQNPPPRRAGSTSDSPPPLLAQRSHPSHQDLNSRLSSSLSELTGQSAVQKSVSTSPFNAGDTERSLHEDFVSFIKLGRLYHDSAVQGVKEFAYLNERLKLYQSVPSIAQDQDAIALLEMLDKKHKYANSNISAFFEEMFIGKVALVSGILQEELWNADCAEAALVMQWGLASKVTNLNSDATEQIKRIKLQAMYYRCVCSIIKAINTRLCDIRLRIKAENKSFDSIRKDFAYVLSNASRDIVATNKRGLNMLQCLAFGKIYTKLAALDLKFEMDLPKIKDKDNFNALKTRIESVNIEKLFLDLETHILGKHTPHNPPQTQTQSPPSPPLQQQQQYRPIVPIQSSQPSSTPLGQRNTLNTAVSSSVLGQATQQQQQQQQQQQPQQFRRSPTLNQQYMVPATSQGVVPLSSSPCTAQPQQLNRNMQQNGAPALNRPNNVPPVVASTGTSQGPRPIATPQVPLSNGISQPSPSSNGLVIHQARQLMPTVPDSESTTLSSMLYDEEWERNRRPVPITRPVNVVARQPTPLRTALFGNQPSRPVPTQNATNSNSVNQHPSPTNVSNSSVVNQTKQNTVKSPMSAPTGTSKETNANPGMNGNVVASQKS
ncbi:unnamed protein product [Ambrosiozyma monospora]|uniref:Unnamed protein product n=1 Tax=Ambrosiozyma monospora TaxID=43982 RepID=A0ACB5T4E1_AMBMO|nr:unnamed protein product [Ambrosiozyma monospora]